MTAQIGLTLKHVAEWGSVCYLGAISIEHVQPTDGRPHFLRIETGEEHPRRECHGGIAYIMNMSGKTIDRIELNSISPQPEPAAA